MLKMVEFGLLAVSLMIVLALIVASPSSSGVAPEPVVDPEARPKVNS